MNLDTGALSQEEKQKFLNWLNEKGRMNPSCPVCGTNNWGVGDHIVQSLPFTPNGLVLGGTSYPSALLVCNNCAFTRSFMAVPIGLMPTPPKEGEKK